MTEMDELGAWKKGDVPLTLFREFNFFDPKHAPVLYAPFTAYVREAREILSERSTEEIEYACMLAEWAVLAPVERIIEEQRGTDTALLAEMTGHVDETAPRLLQRRQKVLNLVGIPEFN